VIIYSSVDWIRDKKPSLMQGILKGEVSLYRWPPVWQVWISLFCKLKQKLSADSKPVKQEVSCTVILPPLVFPACCVVIFQTEKVYSLGRLPVICQCEQRACQKYGKTIFSNKRPKSFNSSSLQPAKDAVTFSIKTFSVMTVSIMTLGITAFFMATVSLTALVSFNTV